MLTGPDWSDDVHPHPDEVRVQLLFLGQARGQVFGCGTSQRATDADPMEIVGRIRRSGSHVGRKPVLHEAIGEFSRGGRIANGCNLDREAGCVGLSGGCGIGDRQQLERQDIGCRPQ